MSLMHNLKQGIQLQCDLHGKVLGKYGELAKFPGVLIQCLSIQLKVAL